ncbi:hypothetical protein A3K86_04870 [Photobacterium jeanii]|uniref:Uncharacterized protein n=1 Tax=Photobacterium jeanii TaxID=858640 RepID=A0A178KNI7_9GAMM|nr:hypothetical protein [Photobacterium jeanii]OAN18233.1 hypothetical protein A3K86_04870 [Photobacterium jeanii]PST92090.1 hypothetical protein C9I91_02605 [Photobacterium jeanii]
MKTFGALLLAILINQTAGAAERLTKKQIVTHHFDGLIIDERKAGTTRLENIEFDLMSGVSKKIDTCSEVNNLNSNNVAHFEFYRFRTLQMACKAVDLYVSAKNANKSSFPKQLSVSWLKSIPANTAPFLSREEFNLRKNKSVDDYYSKGTVSVDNDKFKLLTTTDEIYFTVLARGDFSNNGIEDILIQTDWASREASGVHADLVILSQNSQKSPTYISWRFNQI